MLLIGFPLFPEGSGKFVLGEVVYADGSSSERPMGSAGMGPHAGGANGCELMQMVSGSFPSKYGEDVALWRGRSPLRGLVGVASVISLPLPIPRTFALNVAVDDRSCDHHGRHFTIPTSPRLASI